jgi:Ca2+-binding EF-hand superfamily protein
MPLNMFRGALRTRGRGDLVTAWKELLDPRGLGEVSKEQFLRCCEELGPNLLGDDFNPEEVFNWLDYNKTNSISLFEIDLGSWRSLQQGDDALKLTGQKPKKIGAMNFQERQDYQAARERHRAIIHYEMQQRRLKARAEADANMGVVELNGFLRLLKSRYGSLARAWKEGLDTDGNGVLTFIEFCNAARRIGYGGKIKALWKELDANGNGHISLNEIDAATAESLDKFNEKLTEKGTVPLEKSWRSVLDTNRSGRVELSEFIESTYSHRCCCSRTPKAYAFRRETRSL